MPNGPAKLGLLCSGLRVQVNIYLNPPPPSTARSRSLAGHGIISIYSWGIYSFVLVALWFYLEVFSLEAFTLKAVYHSPHIRPSQFV